MFMREQTLNIKIHESKRELVRKPTKIHYTAPLEIMRSHFHEHKTLHSSKGSIDVTLTTAQQRLNDCMKLNELSFS